MNSRLHAIGQSTPLDNDIAVDNALAEYAEQLKTTTVTTVTDFESTEESNVLNQLDNELESHKDDLLNENENSKHNNNNDNNDNNNNKSSTTGTGNNNNNINNKSPLLSTNAVLSILNKKLVADAVSSLSAVSVKETANTNAGTDPLLDSNPIDPNTFSTAAAAAATVTATAAPTSVSDSLSSTATSSSNNNAQTTRIIVLFSRHRNRLILNKQELITALEKEFLLPVVEVAMETHSFADQIALLKRASVVIGLHGSILIMSMFMPAGEL